MDTCDPTTQPVLAPSFVRPDESCGDMAELMEQGRLAVDFTRLLLRFFAGPARVIWSQQ